MLTVPFGLSRSFATCRRPTNTNPFRRPKYPQQQPAPLNPGPAFRRTGGRTGALEIPCSYPDGIQLSIRLSIRLSICLAIGGLKVVYAVTQLRHDSKECLKYPAGSRKATTLVQ